MERKERPLEAREQDPVEYRALSAGPWRDLSGSSLLSVHSLVHLHYQYLGLQTGTHNLNLIPLLLSPPSQHLLFSAVAGVEDSFPISPRDPRAVLIRQLGEVPDRAERDEAV